VNDFLKRMSSRKFLLCLVGIGGYFLLGVAGQLSWADALENMKLLILAYLGVEGVSDAIGRAKANP
jgi:hypothetical protein